MPGRRCIYCFKPLPRQLRADAMYCSGSRCRVSAYRRRKQLGEQPPSRKQISLQPLGVALDSASPRVLLQLQRKRRQAKEAPLIQDLSLQARAEKEAYSLLRKRLRPLKKEAKQRIRDAKHSSFVERKKFVFPDGGRVWIQSRVTHIGLYVIPSALGGGAIVLTGRKTD